MSGLAEDEQGEEHGEAHEAAPEGDGAAADVQATIEAMLGAIRDAKVGELILSSVSTLASVAYGKLEAKELGEARLAIDAVGALLPLLGDEVDAAIRRDFEQALANLRLAYADAVASSQ